MPRFSRLALAGLALALAGCDLPSGISIPDLAKLPDVPTMPTGASPAPAATPAPARTPAPGNPSSPSTPSMGGAGIKGEALVRPFAQAAATKAKLPLGLVLAVVSQESSFDPRAVSPSGAQGLMQLMPGTVTHINSAGGATILDPFDPEQNLAGGCWYLNWTKSQVPTAKVVAGDEWRFALAGYNAGIGRVRAEIDKALAGAPRNPRASFDDVSPRLPAETRRYVPSVWAKWDKYGR